MNKKITFLFALLLSFAATTQAQLSGSYTVGGASPDYATITDAITAVQVGVTGPVTFNIRPGTYSGTFIIGNVPGSSDANTVTFQSENGDSSSVIITNPASTVGSNFTLYVNGTDYLRFHQVTIERPGVSTNAGVVYIGSNSKKLSFTNCIVRADPYGFTSTSGVLVYIPLGGNQDTLTTFEYNRFEGGSYAINISGFGAGAKFQALQINHNDFIDQDGEAIYLNTTNNALVSNNFFSSASTNFSYMSIHMNNSSQTTIASNNLQLQASCQFGMRIENCTGSTASPMLVKNNFISTNSQNLTAGIEIASTDTCYILNNSINDYSTTLFGFGLSITGSGSSDIRIENNVIANLGGGFSADISPSPISAVTSFDFNDLYVVGTQGLLNYDGVAIADLAALQALSVGANTVSYDPQFISMTDLHAGSAGINDVGNISSFVTDDIDGEVRSGLTPDIGADEFTPLTDNLYTLDILGSGGCGEDSTRLGVVIRNLGSNDQTGFDVNAEVTFPGGNTTLTETYNGTLTPNTNDTIYFTQTINTYAGGQMDLVVYSSLVGDQYNLNDTLRASLLFLDHPNSPSIITPQDQCDNNVEISASPDSGDVLMWYADAEGGEPLYIGNPFRPTVSGDTTFFVEAHHGSGSTGCLRITEIEPNGLGDYIEISNLSGVGFDATGYKVIASDDYGDFTAVNAISWDLDYFNAGEAKYRTDDGTDNYWGSNLLLEPGFPGWVMIIDPQGNIVDFATMLWDSTTIQTSAITFNTFNLTIGSEWSGDGFDNNCVGETSSRLGNGDNNNGTDWGCDLSSKGSVNPNLASVFLNCGIGACASPRSAIDIHLIPGITADLGPDTAFTSSPISYQLSPGQGYSSYLWSTGETTDTITITSAGDYWVMVSGPNGCTIVDSVSISLIDQVAGQLSNDAITFFPNPASDQLNIKTAGIDLNNAQFKIFDARGGLVNDVMITEQNNRSVVVDLKRYEAGIYFVQVITDKGMRVERINVVK